MSRHELHYALGLALLGVLVLVGTHSPAASDPISPRPGHKRVYSRTRPDPGGPTSPGGADVWAPESSGTTAILSSVWGRGTRYVVVGAGGTILASEGASWEPMNSHSTADLQGVWGNSFADIFAAGPDGTVLHYTGVNWQTMTAPTVEFLRGVWGTSPTDVFISGTRGTIIHYDGVRWEAMESGSPNRLYAVWGAAPDDVFISGHLATILHYDGSEWSTMNGGVRQTLWGVWGAAANDVFVVGGAGVITHYDGSSWTPMSSGTDENLLGIWGLSASEVYAVGGGGTIIRYDGDDWSAMTSGTTLTINGIFGTSSDDIVAVGEHGLILHFLGGGVPVFIQDFNAHAVGAAVELDWRIGSPRGVRGFRILKRDAFDHESVLPAGGGPLGNDARTYRDTAVEPGCSYRYLLVGELADGTVTRSAWARADVPGFRVRLYQNHPNPFNPSTRIEFSLAENTPVRLAIFDSYGRKIVELADSTFPPGLHTIEWNGRDSGGAPVASGVYFCRLIAGDQTNVIKLTLTK